MKLSSFIAEYPGGSVQFARDAGLHHVTVWRTVRALTVPRHVTREKMVAATHGKVTEREIVLEASGIPDHQDAA